MIALLSMYDWPEVAAETDAAWVAIRDGLRAEGVAAPETLTRGADLWAAWRDPALVFGQTCGLPLVRGLTEVEVIGAIDYGLPGCPPGFYRSALVTRADDPRETLSAFRGARAAVNGRDSQSGYGALLAAVAPYAEAAGFFGAARVTGSHRASVIAVAAGEADIAAIDCVSWRLAERFEPTAGALRVSGLTEPTPGLPLIAAAGTDVARHRAVAAAVLPTLAHGTAGLRGFAPLTRSDYAMIATRFAAAEARVAIQSGVRPGRAGSFVPES
ncbi:MAG: PhnD/SsuA/transferrin family substrate-binding protein [Amaricoccus sp.]|uniref:phosphate/phosphite/phosphonate ABC transporter substrate-binding protein n=1 Tax=Amaricoccus sp. TaxID=1872485 RepID=UPI003314AE2C